MDDEPVSVGELDAATAKDAAALLRPSCASGAWLELVVAGRPYRGLAALVAASDRAVATLSWADLEQALAAHPRIGQRAVGSDREAAWSWQEQSAALTADVAERLRAGNVEYEQRFGQVFLICATGKSAEQMLSALHERLGNPVAVEREVVRDELRQIIRLRLAKTFGSSA